MIERIEILSVPFSKGTKKEILEEVGSWLREKKTGRYIVTPNPEMVVLADNDSTFQSALVSSDLSLTDGIGIRFAAAILGKHGLTRITGVDFMEELCQLASDMSSKDRKKPVVIGLLGGRGGVAQRTADCLVKKFPHLHIGFVGEEWGKDGFDDALKISNVPTSLKLRGAGKFQISNSIDILFVAFGVPKQEVFMYQNRGTIPVKVMMGVGGAFDYISGDVLRAPKAFRLFGLEWLFRLGVQPWRIVRQFALLTFLYLVFKARFF